MPLKQIQILWEVSCLYHVLWTVIHRIIHAHILNIRTKKAITNCLAARLANPEGVNYSTEFHLALFLQDGSIGSKPVTIHSSTIDPSMLSVCLDLAYSQVATFHLLQKWVVSTSYFRQVRQPLALGCCLSCFLLFNFLLLFKESSAVVSTIKYRSRCTMKIYPRLFGARSSAVNEENLWLEKL